MRGPWHDGRPDAGHQVVKEHFYAKPIRKSSLGRGCFSARISLKMAWGYYLDNSHESYLQNYIAIEMFREQCYPVYIDASPKRIFEDDEMPGNILFDLAFRFKGGDKPRALIEIKRTWADKNKVLADVRKIIEYRNQYDDQVTGYVLWYTHGRVHTIINKFNKMHDIMCNEPDFPGHGLLDSHICESGDPAWGFALYRL